MDRNKQTENHKGQTGKRAELLAPAGSFESLRAAVAAGADAVYLGGTRFGARAYADNFDEEAMLQAIDYAHLHGVSLYMTVNTLVKEKELSGLYDYLAPYYERGLDAVIVQDLGVLTAVRRWFPDMRIHASTQMTVTGVGGVQLLRKLGVSRVVTARELSLQELQEIDKNTDIEVESFIHGALCYCYSGQCLLSSLIGGRSGNRGRCAQPCRLPYDVPKAGGDTGAVSGTPHGSSFPERYLNNKNERYLMSLKDLCTLDILPDILESGVYSLKIEGRMKSPRYTAGVVSVYRKYTDLYLREGRGGYHVDDKDRQMLSALFDRGGQTEGYYRKHNGRDMLVLKEKPAFRQTNGELFAYLDQTYVEADKKEQIGGRLTAFCGQPLQLELWMLDRDADSGRRVDRARYGDVDVFPAAEVSGAVVQAAQNQPMTEERLKRQIEKTGGTPFAFASLEIGTDGRGFVPVQALNELRRDGMEKLKETVLLPYRRDREGEKRPTVGWPAPDDLMGGHPAEHAGNEPWTPLLHALVSDREQFMAAVEAADIAEIQIEADALPAEEWPFAVRLCHDAQKRCVLAMPVIFRTEAAAFFRRCRKELRAAGFDGFLVRALEELDYLHGSGEALHLYADHNLYAFNHLAAETLIRAGCERLTFPLELNVGEMQELAKESYGQGSCPAAYGRKTDFELSAYGYLPAMTTAQCVRSTLSGCDHMPGFLTLKDRTGKELPVYNHCAFCYNTIYNPLPLSLLGMEDAVMRLRPAALRLAFLRETPRELSDTVKAFADAFLRGKSERPAGFTRGHLKRGVE